MFNLIEIKDLANILQKMELIQIVTSDALAIIEKDMEGLIAVVYNINLKPYAGFLLKEYDNDLVFLYEEYPKIKSIYRLNRCLIEEAGYSNTLIKYNKIREAKYNYELQLSMNSAINEASRVDFETRAQILTNQYINIENENQFYKINIYPTQVRGVALIKDQYGNKYYKFLCKNEYIAMMKTHTYIENHLKEKRLEEKQS